MCSVSTLLWGRFPFLRAYFINWVETTNWIHYISFEKIELVIELHLKSLEFLDCNQLLKSQFISKAQRAESTFWEAVFLCFGSISIAHFLTISRPKPAENLRYFETILAF